MGNACGDGDGDGDGDDDVDGDGGDCSEGNDGDDGEDCAEDGDGDDGGDGGDGGDGDDTSRPKFVVYPPQLQAPKPAVVYGPGVVTPTLDLWSGPMWSVPLSAIPAVDVPKHLEAMTCAPKPFMPGAKPIKFPLGLQHGGRLYMPGWYAYLAFPGAVPRVNKYTVGEPMRPGVVFAGTLASHPPQRQAMYHHAQHMASHPRCTGGIVCLPCGYGKTPWFMAVAAGLGRVALFLVHKLPLLDQTREEARRFLPGAKVGYVTAKGVRVEGVDLIVASIQTLHSHMCNAKAHPYLGRLMARVGTVCMDEGHHVAAATFAKVFNSCHARYRIILTATPRRKDNCMPQLQMMAGPVVFRAFRQVKEVHVVTLEYLCRDHVPVLARGGKVLQRHLMEERLVEDEVRTAMVLDVLQTLLRQGRRVLMVTPRVAHLHALADGAEALMEAMGPALALPRKLALFIKARPPPRLTPEQLWEWEDAGPHGKTVEFDCPRVGRVVQGMADTERSQHLNATVVVATTRMMEEGISVAAIDTLINTDNLRDPEQVVGRVLRTDPSKRVPVVVDFFHAAFMGSFASRMKYYRGEGFAVQRIRAASKEDLPKGTWWDQFDKPAPLVM